MEACHDRDSNPGYPSREPYHWAILLSLSHYPSELSLRALPRASPRAVLLSYPPKIDRMFILTLTMESIPPEKSLPLLTQRQATLPVCLIRVCLQIILLWLHTYIWQHPNKLNQKQAKPQKKLQQLKNARFRGPPYAYQLIGLKINTRDSQNLRESYSG